MTEVLGHGRERPPAPPVRRGLLVGLAAMGLLAGAGTMAVLHRDPKPAATHPSPSPSRSPIPVPHGDDILTLPPLAEVPPPGPRLTTKTGLTVLVWGSTLVSYDVDSGVHGNTLIPELPDVAQRYLVPVQDGALALATGSGPFPPAPTAVLRVRLDRSAVRIGAASAIVAARSPGSAWWVTYDDNHTYAQRHDLDGASRSRRLVLPARHLLVGETDLGLLVQRAPILPDGPSLLADIRTGRTRTVTLTSALATTGRYAVTLGEGGPPGTVGIERHDLRTSRVRVVYTDGGVTRSALSPDGKRLALLAGDDLRSSLVVIDVATMARHVYPRIVVPSDQSLGLGWSADSRWLLLDTTGPGGDYLGLWRSGWTRLAYAPHSFAGGSELTAF